MRSTRVQAHHLQVAKGRIATVGTIAFAIVVVGSVSQASDTGQDAQTRATQAQASVADLQQQLQAIAQAPAGTAVTLTIPPSVPGMPATTQTVVVVGPGSRPVPSVSTSPNVSTSPSVPQPSVPRASASVAAPTQLPIVGTCLPSPVNVACVGVG